MASSSNLIPWLFAACGQPRCAQGKSQTKRHTGSLNFLPKKGFADELCVFCARVGAGEGGGGKDTADIEAASCVFLCLHGGQRGRRWRAATVYLRVDRTCLWWQTWRSNRRRGAAYSPALQVLAIYLCTTTKMRCYTVRSRRATLGPRLTSILRAFICSACLFLRGHLFICWTRTRPSLVLD